MSDKLQANAGNASGFSPGRRLLVFLSRHGAPFALTALIWYVLWWGHSPDLATPEEAMRHVGWVGLIALAYIALQARAVLAQPRKAVVHPLIEFLVSVLPLLVVLYAAVDWLRGAKDLSVFQVIVMQQAMVAVLIDVVFFTWFSMRLAQHSLPIAMERS